MITRVLIIGGYGNFGQFIAGKLVNESNIQLIIAGRNAEKASEFAQSLLAKNSVEFARLDINIGLRDTLAAIKPDLVIHTSGPFQGQGYHVARACIFQGCHYVDLADAREFVAGISALDQEAVDKQVLICSGASSVPCLTSAIIDHYIGEFETLESVDYGITTAQQTNRGLATTSAVLSYAGKSFVTLINGQVQRIYGWRDLRLRRFWGLNKRLLGNCDIPDLEIFPERYGGLKNIRFQAGLELKFLHLMLWMLSGLVKVKLFPPLQSLAPFLLKIAKLFDWAGKDDSGFFMMLGGVDHCAEPKEILFELVAHQGDGLFIPSMPAIIMAKKISNERVSKVGATPCVDLITLDEYLDALSEFDIQWRET